MTGVEREATTVEQTKHEARSFVVTGDRLCTTCGYNLIGQVVRRERHYGLLVVRCPECGTVASVQEYPLLGRWARRWGVVLAVLWFIFLLGMWAGSGAAIMGCSMGVAEEASHTYRAYLSEAYEASRQSGQQMQGPQITVGPGGQIITTNRWLSGGNDFRQWWAQQDRPALFAQAGGWRGAVAWEALVIWLPVGITALTIGWFWSVALLQFRRRWVLVWGLFIIALALVFGLGPWLEWVMGTPRSSWSAAMQEIAPTMFAATVVFSSVALALGLAFGRALTRALVRSLLGPGLRGSLALLWTMEGLPPPRGASGKSPGRGSDG